MSNTHLEKILIIDDNSDYRKLIKTFIKKLLPSVEIIEYDPVFKGVPDDNFNWSEIDVLLLDYHLSIVGTTGLDILHQHHKKISFPATIMLTGAGTEEIAIRALKSGIYEYQPKQSLTKDKLKQSIIHAWEDKKTERKKKQEITQHNRAFSKEIFYETLEKTSVPEGAERVLVIIKPDNIDLLGEEIGVIGRDNMVNHIAKNSFEVFKLGACNPNITRISDTEIGIQIDYPNNTETFEFNMQGLCKHLAKCTFKFSEEKYKFSVSIGVLKLDVFNKTADQLIYLASTACDYASKIEGNSYYIWKDTDVAPDFIKRGENHFEKLIEPTEEKNNAKIEAEQEAKKALEIKLRIAEEEKEKLEAALEAKEKEAKVQAELRATQEAKEKQKAEAEIKAAKLEKEKLEAALKAKEEEAKAQAELRAAQEAKQKEKAEADMKAAKLEKEKLEAELKAIVEAKAEVEAEMKATKEEKSKLEAELKSIAKAKEEAEMEIQKEILPEEKTSAKPETKDNKTEADIKERHNSDATNLKEAESQIRKLIKENKITQTYQPITAMFDDENETKEIYNTGLQSTIDGNKLNEYLSDISVLSTSLQQEINKWILRQVFLRITESGTDKCQYKFIIRVTESWFSDIALFHWLQKILSQTKKYNPGKSIILNVPLDIFNKHQKRAQALIETLYKSHQFAIALSRIEIFDNLLGYCSSTSSNLLLINLQQLQKLTETLAPHSNKRILKEDEKNEEEEEQQNMLQYLKSKNIRIITSGIEDSTLLMDAITAGTDYTLGDFVGEVQDNPVESSTVESFELT